MSSIQTRLKASYRHQEERNMGGLKEMTDWDSHPHPARMMLPVPGSKVSSSLLAALAISTEGVPAAIVACHEASQVAISFVRQSHWKRTASSAVQLEMK